MAQRVSNAKAKITRVRIYKARADSSIASMPMDQYELVFAHLAGLLQNLGECSVENDLRDAGRLKPSSNLVTRVKSRVSVR
jgi:hypothetical protein